MKNYIVKYPKDKFLNHRKCNNISRWQRSDFEWSGTREKFIISPPSTNAQYLVKFPKYGINEIRTELFNCCLGLNLGLKLASYFPCIYKGRYGIITRSFLKPRSWLCPMKTLICLFSDTPNLQEHMGRHNTVLKEHNIDNIYTILDSLFEKSVLQKFFQMIGFDCLIGHGDRHWTNYGVLVYKEKEMDKSYFSPIYDTASGYLLELSDKALSEVLDKEVLDSSNWYRPKKKGLCKMTCSGDITTNHIELFEYILDKPKFKDYQLDLIKPIANFNIILVNHLLKSNFYMRDTSKDRRFIINKILKMRHNILASIMKERGFH